MRIKEEGFNVLAMDEDVKDHILIHLRVWRLHVGPEIRERNWLTQNHTNAKKKSCHSLNPLTKDVNNLE